MTDDERKMLLQIVHLLQGLAIEHKGHSVRSQSSNDLLEQVLKEIQRTVQKMLEERRKRTLPGDSK